MKILVSGSEGQVGSELKLISSEYSKLEFIFTNRTTLDISNISNIEYFFEKHKPDWFINCAAYTAVDNAEENSKDAFRINAEAPLLLAKTCEIHNCKLLHYSSDYVYHNLEKDPMVEESETLPKSEYAKSKLLGEQHIIENCSRYIILRTSWVYSTFGSNFVKTMLRLGNKLDNLNIVNDQIGAPTYARDIAETSIAIIQNISAENHGLFWSV